MSTLDWSGSRTPGAPLPEPLTRRELVVLHTFSEDVTLEEIASKLWVTRNTVNRRSQPVTARSGCPRGPTPSRGRRRRLR